MWLFPNYFGISCYQFIITIIITIIIIVVFAFTLSRDGCNVSDTNINIKITKKVKGTLKYKYMLF